MKTIILNILLIFNILPSPLTASKEVTDQLTKEILITYEEISEIIITLSNLKAHQINLEHRSVKTAAQSDPVSQKMTKTRENLRLAQVNLYILLEKYKEITRAPFAPSPKHPSYIPSVQSLTLNSPAPSGVSGKFTTTSTGLHAYKKTTQALPQSELSGSSNQLCLNIKDEHTRLAELKELLQTAPYQDPASPQTQELYCQIEQCLQIIDGCYEYLIILMYPNRSIESLKEEAQNNGLGSVKLVLHKDGYFHIPKPFLTPDTPRKRPRDGLKRTATFHDFSSCDLSNTSSGNSSFVSAPPE